MGKHSVAFAPRRLRFLIIIMKPISVFVRCLINRNCGRQKGRAGAGNLSPISVTVTTHRVLRECRFIGRRWRRGGKTRWKHSENENSNILIVWDGTRCIWIEEKFNLATSLDRGFTQQEKQKHSSPMEQLNYSMKIKKRSSLLWRTLFLNLLGIVPHEHSRSSHYPLPAW